MVSLWKGLPFGWSEMARGVLSLFSRPTSEEGMDNVGNGYGSAAKNSGLRGIESRHYYHV